MTFYYHVFIVTQLFLFHNYVDIPNLILTEDFISQIEVLEAMMQKGTTLQPMGVYNLPNVMYFLLLKNVHLILNGSKLSALGSLRGPGR